MHTNILNLFYDDRYKGVKDSVYQSGVLGWQVMLSLKNDDA